MRPEAEPWWRQAQADLETARITLDAGRDYAASWFAQQAVEKGLKALYIDQQGTLAPRTTTGNTLAVRWVPLPE
jgi:HEPN domain-containing protein